jgi:TolB protein
VGVVSLFSGYWWWDNAEPSRDGAPNWSPDGQRIVFMAEIGTGKGDIYIMNRDGSGRRRLTDHPANDSTPAMSPDGRSIAFESDRDGTPDIYVMDADGGNVRRLTSDPARDLSPAWSPDGQRIAFTSDRHERAAADVYLMRADGSAIERVTSDRSNWAPQFSPDGSRLAVQIDRDSWIFDLSTGEKRRLTFEPQNGMNPTWSSDGQRVAFVTTRNGKAEIFVASADGGAAEPLVSMPEGSVIDPRWSPTGTHVAFVLIPEGAGPEDQASAPAIYTIEIASQKITRVSR